MNVALVHPPVQASDGSVTNAPGLRMEDADVKQSPYYNVTYAVGDLEATYPGSGTRWSSWLQGKIAASVVAPRAPEEIKDVPSTIPLEYMHAKTVETPSLDQKLF